MLFFLLHSLFAVLSFYKISQVADFFVFVLIKVVSMTFSFFDLPQVVVKRLLFHSYYLCCIFRFNLLILIVWVVVASDKPLPLRHFSDHITYSSLFDPRWLRVLLISHEVLSCLEFFRTSNKPNFFCSCFEIHKIILIVIVLILSKTLLYFESQ